LGVFFNILKKEDAKNTSRVVLQYATVKARPLTDIKEFAFSANGRFVQTGAICGRFRLVFVIK
jgi:hypothetical protein